MSLFSNALLLTFLILTTTLVASKTLLKEKGTLNGCDKKTSNITNKQVIELKCNNSNVRLALTKCVKYTSPGFAKGTGLDNSTCTNCMVKEFKVTCFCDNENQYFDLDTYFKFQKSTLSCA